MASKIIGCGAYLPERIVTNFDLEKLVDTSDEWIHSRTGISQRHIARDDEFTSHLAFAAAKNAIADANIQISDIDLIMVATNTPDNSFPSVANKLQSLLGAGQIPSFDLQAICSGFLYGLQLADSLIASNKYRTILFVCADKMTSLLDWTDRSTCVLFGDGAGAVILQHSKSNSRIIDSKIYSDGSYYDILYTDGGVSTTGKSGKIKMNGKEVFRNAVEKMASSITEILLHNNIELKDIDHVVPHQANIRIITNIAERLNIDQNKIVATINKHGNCSAASIPIALSELKSSGKIKSNDLIIFTAAGAGFTWGSALLRW